MPDGDSSPCIDGLKIFPEVQERRREDGLTDYIVSAYGRANSTGNITRSIDAHTLQLQIAPIITSPSSSTSPFLNAIVATNTLTRSVVVPASASNSAIPLPTPDTTFTVLRTDFDFLKSILKIAYPTLQLTLGSFDGAISVSHELKSLTRTSYGSFDEVSATLNGTPSRFGYVTVTYTI